SLQGKISSDGCLKKEQMVVSAIASTPHIAVLEIALVSLAAEPAGKLHEYKPVGYQRLVDELTMLVKQLTWQLRKAKPDCKLPDKAMSYLERNGLISVEDILR
ncbi:hypothetical protein, partial [Escherichia coli]|uniref:hypothetical protein n=1 Tax=Escherichia coli TaxID=562 RepID=UPI00207777D3